MIGCFITRGLVLVLGYAYPAYECFKTVEMNKPDIEQLLFWCQYWILVAGLTVCERIGDMFIGWVPMYSEAKLAFFIYLWYPKTKGTRYVYDSFFRPYVAKHETEIDRSLCELRTRAGDMAFLYWQKAASYGQTRVFDILQYFASQSNPPRPSQQAAKSHKPTTPSKRSAATTQLQRKEPPSPTSSASSSQHQEDTEVDGGPSVGPGGAPVATASSNGSKTSTEASKEVALPTTTSEGPKATSTQALVKASKSLGSSEEKMMLISSVPPPASENVQPPPQETILEVKRRTGARLKKTRTR